MKSTFGPFRDKTLMDFLPENDSQEAALKAASDYVERLDDNRFDGKGLTIIGPVGVGKTLLASAVLNGASTQGYRIESIELSTYVGMHKDMFGLQAVIRARPDDDDLLDEYIKLRQHIRVIEGTLKHSADFVLFDAVGHEYASESGWNQNQFADTLRTRWDRKLPSLVTSHMPIRDLDDRFGEGLASLLIEATEVLVVEGADHRWKKAS